MTRSRGIQAYHRRWSRREFEILRHDYPHLPSRLVAEKIGRPLCSVYAKAKKIGLKKSAAFLASSESGRLTKLTTGGIPFRYPKGHVPANKGLRRPGYAPGRMRETQFKKGQRGNKWMPIGSYRLMDGYRQQKVTETGYPPRDWVGLHILLWRKARRRIPRGHCIAFKDGDRTHIVLENLECISRGELARRNHWKNFPEALRSVITLRIAIKRRITMRERNGKQHDRGSAKPPLRDAAGSQGQGQAARHRARQGGVQRRRKDHRLSKGRGRLPEGARRDRIRIHPGWDAEAHRAAGRT